jgi:hypothetical protein
MWSCVLLTVSPVPRSSGVWVRFLPALAIHAGRIFSSNGLIASRSRASIALALGGVPGSGNSDGSFLN